MNNEEKAAKFWREKILPKEREIKMLAADCKKQGRRTEAYTNACKDMQKLKDEYEEIRGGMPYDPMNPDHVESAAQKTARQFLGFKPGQGR